ncbi:helix-turn-helix domain-containing protein [Rhodohalobacter sulfatireducens]|uniref:Helix-turn-helix domain-containing protein n=1 Tax=Rhodohalobacter sulfatireducens TaxID=2911366 RepID=A0ABS9KJV1_9BACT|nr:helix-turn-helix domain-containing protein [Rhodohalobacter sulfatireducens]MCG2591067.1 helix-turn-helix domain-containing protein [Rhodohalobacter sulfatireducens]
MSSENNLDKDLKKKASKETLIEILTKEIDANLNNDQFGVESLAKVVGMSRSSLHRKIKRNFGISTSQFIREHRLKKALKILGDEDITASETAFRVGFSSPTYFNTCFHKYYGFTPGEAKSRNGHNNDHPIRSENAAGSINYTQKKLAWTVFLASTLLIITFYFYVSDANQNEVIFNNEQAIDEKSIVVLPIKNWTGTADLEYISDGMTDAIISRLTKIDAIDKVIPFTSALKYKQTDKTIQEIAAESGVAHLLQGNLQISGSQIKINLQLIHGRSNVHLWSEEYTKEWNSDEIFIMQAEVVEAIAKNMMATISEYELADIQRAPTRSKQAYSYFLQAEFQRNKANAESYKNAIELYGKSIEIDPDFVEAYTSEARVWSFGGLVWGIFDQRVAWQNAKLLLEKALEIDPDNRAVEEELYSGYFYYDWNFRLVEQYYQKMINDFFYDDTPSINADYAIKTGRYLESISAMNELILINPAFGPAFCFKAEALMLLGRSDDALDLLESTNSLYSDNWFYLRESAKLFFYLGEYENSKIQLEKIQSQFSDYPPILMWLNATFAQMDGDSKNKDKYLAQLFEEYNNGSSGSPAWFIAMYYSSLKDYEKAFTWLQKSYERHEVEMTWLREEPLLAPIRGDLRYKELYRKVGFTGIGLPIKTS